MAQLSSTNVKVFPSAYRGQGIDPEARLNSERNLSAALNAITDVNDGFVIDYDSTSKVCTFILGGYWFEANLTGQTLTGSVYAHIKVGDRGSASDAWNCKSLLSFGSTPKGELDANNNFTGLIIDANATYEGATHNLLLLQNGSVPAASKLKIKSSSIADDDVKEPISEHLTAQNIYSDNVQVDTKLIAEEAQFTTGITCDGWTNLDGGFRACWDGQGKHLAHLDDDGIFYARGIDLTDDGARGSIYASELSLIDSAIYFEQESRPTLTKANSNVVIACRHFNQPSRDVELTLYDDSSTPTYKFSDNAVLLASNSASIGKQGANWSSAYITEVTSTTTTTKNLKFASNGTIQGTATITGTLNGDINGHVNTDVSFASSDAATKTFEPGHNYIISVTPSNYVNYFSVRYAINLGVIYLPESKGLAARIWTSVHPIPGVGIRGVAIEFIWNESQQKWIGTYKEINDNGAYVVGVTAYWYIQDLGKATII